MTKDENSVCDTESSIGSRRGLKRKSSSTRDSSSLVTKAPKVQLKDPAVRIGQVRQTGRKSDVVPQDIFVSTTKPFVAEGFVEVKKATKKPNGQGLSVGKQGEITILVNKSPRPKRNKKKIQSDDFVYDEVCPSQLKESEKSGQSKSSRSTSKATKDPDFEPTKAKKKRGCSNIGRMTRDAKRMTQQRYVLTILIQISKLVHIIL